MTFFASRPRYTYFDESPLGWYLYRWEVATTPAYVEWREWANFAFIAIHLLFALALVWFTIKRVSRRSR
jgi:uncharacterized membrane protein YhdT